MSDVLKPCPFCKTELQKHPQSKKYMVHEMNKCVMRGFVIDVEDERWNTRHQDEATDAMSDMPKEIIGIDLANGEDVCVEMVYIEREKYEDLRKSHAELLNNNFIIPKKDVPIEHIDFMCRIMNKEAFFEPRSLKTMLYQMNHKVCPYELWIKFITKIQALSEAEKLNEVMK